MTALTVVLAIIAVLLFYRWVDRRHKIRILQISLVLGVLAGVGLWWYVGLEERGEEALRSSVQVSNDAASTQRFSFEICNTRDVRLESYTIRVQGFETGRSTPHSLTSEEYEFGRSYTDFSSDIIVAPDTCQTISWSGIFTPYDSIHWRLRTGTFADGETFF